MKRINYGGKVHSFPDDATDEDISRALASLDQPAQAPAKGGFLSGVYEGSPIPALIEMGKGAIQHGRQLQQDFNAAPGMLDKAGVLGKGVLEATPGYQMTKGILANSGQQLGQARDLYRQGDYTGAVGRAAAAVPIVGPLADQVTDTAITEDNPTKAAGQVTGILASAFAPKIAAATKPVLSKAAGKIKAGAATRYEKILNPTTKGNKIRTAEVTPGLLDRRFTARSLDDFAKKATEAKEAAGAAIGDAFDSLPGDTVVTLDPIVQQLATKTIEKFTAPGPNGARLPVNTQAEGAIRTAEDLVRRLGDASVQLPDGTHQISVAALRKFKQGFDDIGRQAGRFEGQTLADQSAAAVQAIAADASRGALNSQFPEIAALNKEFGFWKDVERVALDTSLRRKGQAPSLLTDIAKGAGTVAGGSAGGLEGALAGRAALGALSGARRNPFIQTHLAAKQAAMADAVARFNPAPYGILGPVSLGQQGILSQGDR